jgi:hypothetical protein
MHASFVRLVHVSYLCQIAASYINSTQRYFETMHRVFHKTSLIRSTGTLESIEYVLRLRIR